MKNIYLTKSKYTIVDDEDYEMLNQYKWYYDVNKNGTQRVLRTGYAGGKYTKYSMPRIIMNAPSSMVVDHVNRNQLDNRKTNLRVCTQRQNCMNAKQPSGKYTCYKGLKYYDKNPYRPWIARIRVNNKTYSGKFRSTEEVAALDYNVLAKKYHGEYAVYNNIMAAKK